MGARLKEFYATDEEVLNLYARQVFKGQPWLEPFMESSHHGIEHGHDVGFEAIKMVPDLTEAELKQFIREGFRIDENNHMSAACASVYIAAAFHDCGRYGDDGELYRNQEDHPVLSAARVRYFCEALGLPRAALPYLDDAVLHHDFQSQERTPVWSPPTTMIGKLVQASDQLGWFEPDSVYRTLAYTHDQGKPFYDHSASIEERVAWTGVRPPVDAVTVLMAQLYGPTGPQRFGVSPAKKSVEELRPKLQSRILEIAEEHDVRDDVDDLIVQYGRAYTAEPLVLVGR